MLTLLCKVSSTTILTLTFELSNFPLIYLEPQDRYYFQNILLRITESADDYQVEALISDFGLAKDMNYKERTLSQVGSVDWMAPEVILGML